MYWDYPNKNYTFCGDKVNFSVLHDALICLRRNMFDRRYSEDFGTMRNLNMQLMYAINYLKDEVDNYDKFEEYLNQQKD